MNNLFRAKTTKKENENHGFNNVWVYGDLLTNKGVYYIHPQNNVFRIEGELAKILIAHEVLSETVGRFTGLTDKNGKKIFEGDIVIYGDEKNEVVFERQNGSAYFGVKLSEGETWEFCYSVNASSMEVVGNIHDNPELLEVVNE